MTRDEHLEFCRRCLNRKFDANSGIVWNLTGQIASFEKECADFKIDNSVVIIVDDQVALAPTEIKTKLPPEIYEGLRREQNLSKAIIIGLLTGVLCAILWAAFTVYTTVQFRGMALLLGAGVGYAMRKSGKGIDLIFGIWGAGISLLGCLLGNFLSLIGFLANANDLGYFETLLGLIIHIFLTRWSKPFTFNIYSFYALAIAAGFALGKKTISEKDVKTLKEKRNAKQIIV